MLLFSSRLIIHNPDVPSPLRWWFVIPALSFFHSCYYEAKLYEGMVQEPLGNVFSDTKSRFSPNGSYAKLIQEIASSPVIRFTVYHHDKIVFT
jgi:hypothetical protein